MRKMLPQCDENCPLLHEMLCLTEIFGKSIFMLTLTFLDTVKCIFMLTLTFLDTVKYQPA